MSCSAWYLVWRSFSAAISCALIAGGGLLRPHDFQRIERGEDVEIRLRGAHDEVLAGLREGRLGLRHLQLGLAILEVVLRPVDRLRQSERVAQRARVARKARGQGRVA